jgi:hypothetical protein
MVPIHWRSSTLEDPSIDTPESRLAHYGQQDHVRLYGRDFAARVASTGFSVEEANLCEHRGAQEAARYGLIAHDTIFVSRPSE